MEKIQARVRAYWTKRATDFRLVREMELEDEISHRWLQMILKYLPKNRKLRILDVGTGTGYFAILLALQGHDVCGVDLTPAMIEEAEKLASMRQLSIRFQVMDAQKLEFESGSFDVVIARNLTWTLPEPEKAYSEWLRVLVEGGILLNFDADYGKEVRLTKEDAMASKVDLSGFHIGLTEELLKESHSITESMKISTHKRPNWDINILEKMGCSCYCDTEAGSTILMERNGSVAPTFLIIAIKES